jgi:hypothetical protein
MAKKALDQAGKRRGGIWRDQHGREWAGTMDRMAGMPIGELAPVSGHKDGVRFGWRPQQYLGKDLVPSIHYMKFDEDRLGQFVIEYDRWKADLEQAHRFWHEQAENVAYSLYKDMAGEALKNPPRELATLTGPKPMPVELVEAMIAENKWILGLSDKRPDWADELLPKEAAPGRSRFADVEDEEPELATAGAERAAGRARDDKGRLLPKE